MCKSKRVIDNVQVSFPNTVTRLYGKKDDNDAYTLNQCWTSIFANLMCWYHNFQWRGKEFREFIVQAKHIIVVKSWSLFQLIGKESCIATSLRWHHGPFCISIGKLEAIMSRILGWVKVSIDLVELWCRLELTTDPVGWWNKTEVQKYSIV